MLIPKKKGPGSRKCQRAGDRYNRRKKHGGLVPSEMKRPKQLEEEKPSYG